MEIALDELETALLPVLERLGLHLYDVEITGNGRARVLRVSVDREGGIDTDALERATRSIDAATEDLLAGSYLLEVSSPGLERSLRRPWHFVHAVGEMVSVKHRADGAATRDRGTLLAADDGGITLSVDGHERRIAYPAIVAARTVFAWEAAPQPGKGSRPGSKSKARGAASGATRGSRE
jgi:ribosome maturation factor RimP